MKNFRFIKLTVFFISVQLLPFSGMGQYKILWQGDSGVGQAFSGLVYCLPSIQLGFEFILDKTQKTPGPFAPAAKEMLGLDNVINNPETSCAIVGVRIQQQSLPDPDQWYLVKWNKIRNPLKAKPKFKLDPQGFLMAYNMQVPQTEPGEDIRIMEEIFYPTVQARQRVQYHLNPTLFKQSEADTTPFPRFIYKVRPSDDPLTKSARNAAGSLARILENKVNLASGYQEVAYSEETLRLMFEKLEEEEEEVLSLFIGNTETVRRIETVFVTPGIHDTLPIVLGRFHPVKGFSASPLAEGTSITLTLLKEYNGQSDPPENQSKRKSSNYGLAYRQPACTQVIIRLGDKTLYSTQILLPQMGKVGRLPLHCKKASFDPAMGNVVFYK